MRAQVTMGVAPALQDVDLNTVWTCTCCATLQHLCVCFTWKAAPVRKVYLGLYSNYIVFNLIRTKVKCSLRLRLESKSLLGADKEATTSLWMKGCITRFSFSKTEHYQWHWSKPFFYIKQSIYAQYYKGVGWDASWSSFKKEGTHTLLLCYLSSFIFSVELFFCTRTCSACTKCHTFCCWYDNTLFKCCCNLANDAKRLNLRLCLCTRSRRHVLSC